MELFPSSAPHWHILLNHFPSVGMVGALGLLVCAFYLKSEQLTRITLGIFVILGLLAIPTYVTGAATRWALRGQPGISNDLMAAHQDSALLTFISLLITAWVAWFTLWQYRRFSKPFRFSLPTVSVLAVVTLLFLIRTGSLGGTINHPEIRLDEAVPVPGWTSHIAAWVVDGPWTWPTLEAAHFIGMSMLFGVMLLITLRVLGVGRSVPFKAFHRLLPLGTFGLMINVVSGMLFFVADSGRYSAMTNSFFPKMALLAAGGVAMTYFTIFEKPWSLKPGDDAPISAKVVAVATILMWSGVIIYGRLLPYLNGG
jgi:hypothetical protein